MADAHNNVIVFDVNETLLDLRVLGPHFERAFGDESVLKEWFSLLLQSSLLATITGDYHDFGALAEAALSMTAERRGIALSDEDKDAILKGVRALPPHPEVPESLQRLQDAGFRLATFTNSAPDAAEAQMKHAGLEGYFERILSVDPVRKFKPAPETYQYAAHELGVETKDILFVAAHHWDILGAADAGCKTAFIAREGKVLSPLQARPEIVGKNLSEVVDVVLEGR